MTRPPAACTDYRLIDSPATSPSSPLHPWAFAQAAIERFHKVPASYPWACHSPQGLKSPFVVWQLPGLFVQIHEIKHPAWSLRREALGKPVYRSTPTSRLLLLQSEPANCPFHLSSCSSPPTLPPEPSRMLWHSWAVMVWWPLCFLATPTPGQLGSHCGLLCTPSPQLGLLQPLYPSV